MIKFRKCRFKNFLAVGNDWLEIDLAANPMTLLVGPNGAGKSTLLDAICYNLFNKAYRKVNLPQLVNSINLSECLTETEFDIGPKQYLVRRGMKPSIFEIYENGKLIEQDAAKRDYQRYFENTILGMRLDAFKQIVVVGQEDFRPFMKLEAGDRRNIIEDLLDIGVFSTMNQILKQRQAETESMLDGIKISTKSVMEKIELQKKYIAESKKSTSEQIDELQKQLDFSCNKKANTELEIQNVNELITTELATQTDDIEKLKNKRAKYLEMGIQIKSNWDKAKHRHAFFEQNDSCPTCSQVLNNKDEMASIALADVGKFGSGYKGIQQTIEEYDARLEKMAESALRVSGWHQQIARFQHVIQTCDETIDGLQRQIDTLKAQPVSNTVMEVSQQLFQELQELNGKKQEALQTQQYQDIAESLLKDSGIKAQIIRQYLPVINTTVNKYLAQLDFFVDFNIDSEFNETIKSRHRDEFTYGSFSAGQKRRIDLSLLFTWRAISKLKNSVDTNILILDEVLDGSLDSDGMEEFLHLLKIFTANTNAFVISHRGDVLADKFEHVLKFTMAGNFTEMEDT